MPNAATSSLVRTLPNFSITASLRAPWLLLSLFLSQESFHSRLLITIKMTTPVKIYVGNLSWHTTDQSLRDAFSPFGELQDSIVMKDRETGRSRGFGFVTFRNGDEANAAITSLHESELDGRRIRVNMANSRTSGGGGGYNMGGGGMGGYGQQGGMGGYGSGYGGQGGSYGAQGGFTGQQAGFGGQQGFGGYGGQQGFNGQQGAFPGQQAGFTGQQGAGYGQQGGAAYGQPQSGYQGNYQAGGAPSGQGY
ncbi:unnamed protein product [Tilletia controversa]|nr:unnamed protein product [Tilletia controversa]CAD6924394.1 unnamed protein product [Tilletia controversa]